MWRSSDRSITTEAQTIKMIGRSVHHDSSFLNKYRMGYWQIRQPIDEQYEGIGKLYDDQFLKVFDTDKIETVLISACKKYFRHLHQNWVLFNVWMRYSRTPCDAMPSLCLKSMQWGLSIPWEDWWLEFATLSVSAVAVCNISTNLL